MAIKASATDNVAMAGVQFLLDGANLGAELTGAGPVYTYNWNTNPVTRGTHILSARARDASNNTSLAANISVNVTGLLAAY